MNQDEYRTWLKSLKVGDEVAIKHVNNLSHKKTVYTIDKIISITSDRMIKTEIFPYEFFGSGAVIHDVWDSQIHILTQVNQGIRDLVEMQELESMFGYIDKTDLSLDQLRGIKAIIDGGKS